MKKLMRKIIIVLLLSVVAFAVVACDGKPPIKSMYCVNPSCNYKFNFARAQIGMRRTCPQCGTTNILQ